MKRYLRFVLILLILLAVIAYLLLNFGGGGFGTSSGSDGSSPTPVSNQPAESDPRPPVEPIDTSSVSVVEDGSGKEAITEISEVKVTKKSGEIVVLINGKADKDWKQTLKTVYSKNPITFYLSASGNVSYNELQTVKDFLLAEGIDFVD